MIAERIAALPCWRGQITAEPLTGGLSNEAWVVTDKNGRHVVRFGRDYPFHHVIREREVMTARAAHAAGFGPAMEYAAPGVMVSAFIEAKTWDAADMRSNPARLAELLRRFHTEMPHHISGPGFIFDAFHVIRDYARILAGTEWADHLPPLVALARSTEAVQVPLPIVVGHHDMLPANVLETEDRLWLIDYEYAGFGTAMFDLASAASNARMGGEAADLLVGTYLGRAPETAFRQAFDAMRCAGLIREAMWAMVSEQHLSTSGVDFAAYAEENLTALDAMIEAYQSTYGKFAP